MRQRSLADPIEDYSFLNMLRLTHDEMMIFTRERMVLNLMLLFTPRISAGSVSLMKLLDRDYVTRLHLCLHGEYHNQLMDLGTVGISE